jgi:hypothetical protein
MEHRGIQYQVLETANPAGFIWTVYLKQDRTKIGVSFSNENAIFNAMRAIDKALAMKPKNAGEL